MNDKLEQLTQKLYTEGLAEGRAEGNRILAEAEAKAKKIVSEAEAEAAEIVKKATRAAEDLQKNTMTELSLASREAVGKLKDEIATMIVAKSVEGGVKQAGIDPEFIKEILLSVAKNWDGASSGKVTLSALLPESKQKELDAAFEKSAKELLAGGIEVGYSADVKSGFKVGAKNGGYYISFSDEDFQSLLGSYLRERVSTILYNKE
jgi:V/A-type H+-transporting ATPase subunit E